jgi:hypothetical protein
MSEDRKLTVLDPRGQPSGLFGRSVVPGGKARSILDPQNQPTTELKPLHMAPRLDTLNGKVVYLVDQGFAGGYEFLEEVQGWFFRNMPSVTTIIKRKNSDMFSDDPALWPEIQASGHALILGVGG